MTSKQIAILSLLSSASTYTPATRVERAQLTRLSNVGLTRVVGDGFRRTGDGAKAVKAAQKAPIKPGRSQKQTSAASE